MATTVFYVAINSRSDIFKPCIVEKFDNRADADSYAALMCRAKQRNYIVLEQVTDWECATQEK